MMIQGQSMHEDGTSSTYDDTYKRLSGTSGMEGKWLNVRETENGVPPFKMAVTGDTIKLEYPANGEVIEGKLDGSDSTVKGPTIPPDAFESFKAEGPGKLRFVTKYKTKILGESTYTLSNDVKILTREEWVPGKMNEKSIFVFDKQ